MESTPSLKYRLASSRLIEPISNPNSEQTFLHVQIPILRDQLLGIHIITIAQLSNALERIF